MVEIIPHYRAKCVADFAIAEEGSINIEDYAHGFKDQERIEGLKKELEERSSLRFSFENIEKTTEISRKLSHEISRAIFPFRYIRYGTSIFGSARLEENDPEFKEVVEISKGIVSESRVDINTGGGPGVMEAANLGLKEAGEFRKRKNKQNGAKNNGITIKLPFEEDNNSHLDLSSNHSTFGTRLNDFADKSNSTISWDGGGGTDLEISYVFQLKQVGHIESNFPIILKREIWEEVQEAKMKVMYHARLSQQKRPLVSPQDLALIHFVDTPDEAVQAVLRHYEQWKSSVWSKLDEESQKLVYSDS